MIDVLCVGHASVDLSLAVDAYPAENSKLEIQSWLECGGGPAANAAYLLSKWGNRCAFAGWVGEDAYGETILREFAAAGTDTTLVQRLATVPTPLSIILVSRRTGSRTIINRKAPGVELALAPTPASWKPEVLLFDGHELAAARAAMARFPSAATILDAGSLRDGTRALADAVDYLVASERFALQLTGLESLATPAARLEALAALARPCHKAVVITRGEEGLAYRCGARTGELPAFPAAAVDTTGAGDVFHGAFAHGILNGLPLGETLRLASLAAALSVAVAGARPSIPELGRVTEALAHAR